MVCRIEGTLKHARFLAQHLHGSDPQYAVLAVLMDLEVATAKVGFDYLRNAILMSLRDPAMVYGKGIYLEVARCYTPAISADQVEHGIRRAIQDAWKNRDDEVWACYFPTDRNGSVKKPTNTEFISRIARFLELWQGCCKEVDYAAK